MSCKLFRYIKLFNLGALSEGPCFLNYATLIFTFDSVIDKAFSSWIIGDPVSLVSNVLSASVQGNAL